MNKKLINIPTKKLIILNQQIKLSRIRTKLNLLYSPTIHVYYYKNFHLDYSIKRLKDTIYKFTGTHKKKLDYKNYKILYFNKYLKYNLNYKNFQFHILTSCRPIISY